MFKYTHVLNATTGNKYYIDRAELMNDEGYDESQNGGNLFQIDLQPESPDDSPILNIDLYVCNNGYEVQITKNLDKNTGYSDEDGDHVVMTDALIEGKTLIIANQ